MNVNASGKLSLYGNNNRPAAGPDDIYDEFDNGRANTGPDAVVDEFDNHAADRAPTTVGIATPAVAVATTSVAFSSASTLRLPKQRKAV